MKKVLSLLFALGFVFLFGTACFNSGIPSNADDFLEEDGNIHVGKVLDLYVIIGQSNAAGISQMDKFADPTKINTIENQLAENIYYYGRAENNIVTAYKTPVAFGQGQNKNRFGPEIGLSLYLSNYHVSTNDALIFKYAFGGTSLVNALDWNSNKRWGGTWTPPSADVPKADRAGYQVTYTTPSGITETGNVATGALYDGMLRMLSEAVALYTGTDRYDFIKLKGIFWMQGEAEANNYGAAYVNSYEEYLKMLISDIRTDFSEMKILDSTVAPFIIGKIAKTFNGGGAGVDYIRSLQDKVASDTDYCFTVETEDYIIGLSNPECHDVHHFGASDMISLGENFGKAVYKMRMEISALGEGSYFITTREGNHIIEILPAAGHVLNSVFLDGEEVTIDVVLNNYILIVPRNKHHTVTIVFN